MSRGTIDIGVGARKPARYRRLRRILAWTLGIVALYAIVGFLVAPPIAKSQAEQRLAALLGRDVAIERVAINPFLLSVRVSGFAVKPRGADASATVLAFEELHARLSYASVTRLAPVLAEIALVRPDLRLVRLEDRTYNVQDLIEAFSEQPRTEGPRARFSVNNARLVDGRVTLDDRPEQKLHEVTGINLSVPSISSLDVHVDRFVEPKLEAVINGDPVRVTGETKPFQDSLETRLSVKLEDVDLPRYLAYSPVDLAFTLPSAKLDATIELTFAQTPKKAGSLVVRGDTWVRELALADRTGEEVLGFRRLHVRLRSLDPFARTAAIERIALDGPRIEVRRAQDGSLNLLSLVRHTEAGAAGTDSQPFALEIGEIAVTEGAATLIDLAPEAPFRRAIRNLRFTAKGLSNAADARAAVELALDTSAASEAPAPASQAGSSAAASNARLPATEPARLSFVGKLGLAPISTSGTIELTNLRLSDLHPYVASAINGEVRGGRLDASATLDLALRDGEPSGKVSAISTTLSGLAVHQRDAKAPLLRLAAVEVADGEVSLAERAIALGRVRLDQPALKIGRDRDGTIDALRILPAREAAPAAAAPAPWSMTIRKLTLEGGGVDFEDRTVRPAAKIAVSAVSLAADDLGTPEDAKNSGILSARINRTGSLTLKGAISPKPAANLTVDLRDVDLGPFQPYVKPHAKIEIARGKLTARGTVDIDAAAELTARYRGELAAADVAIAEEDAEGDLLRWQSLRLAGIDATMLPRRVEIKEVSLKDFFSRLVLDASGEFNLQRLARTDASDPAAARRPADPSKRRDAPESKAVDWLRVGAMRLENGDIDFSDRFVRPNYSAKLSNLDGTISTLAPDQAGELALRGRLSGSAPLEISGRINPLAANLELDIKAAARGIELSPLTPYSAKYLGYGIEKGKLTLTVEYVLQDRKLTAENNIRLDQLTFGKKVESPEATDLPVLAAVSLLKDKQGVIDVDLPISGSLDDPKFSVGAVVLRVLLNTIAKAVTAPFALLASVVGEGSQELSFVEFAPGRAALDAQARDKLDTLARALAERPALKLDIVGRADAAIDREGLKRAALERRIRQAKYEQLREASAAPESLGAVKVDAKEYPALLKRVYSDADIPDKPRNVLGIPTDLPVPEMERQLLASVQIGEDELRALGETRAQAAKSHLVDAGKVAPDRLFLVAPKIAPADAQEKKIAGARIDFALH